MRPWEFGGFNARDGRWRRWPVATGCACAAARARDRSGRDRRCRPGGRRSADPGAIIGVQPNGTKVVLASTGLEFPTAMAVTANGAAYVSNYGVLSATGGPEGLSGEIVRVEIPASWDGASPLAPIPTA